MIDSFRGEFLIHPSPVEITSGSCGYGCAYCFAKHRKTTRKKTTPTDIRMLRGESKSQSLCAEFVRRGYSICISNKSDPFSPPLKADTRALFAMLAKRHNSVFIQTKGGECAIELLRMLNPDKTTLYVTITTSDDAITTSVEPGTPLYKDRLNLISEASRIGIACIAGLNPVVRQWWPGNSLPDAERQMINAGASAFLIQQLHLSRNNLAAMSDVEKRAMGIELIEDAQGRERNPWFLTQLKRHLDNRYNTLSIGMPFATTYYQRLEKNLGLHLPCNHRFLNKCASRGKGIATFADYYQAIFTGHEWLAERPTKEAQKYILCNNRGVWRGNRRVQSITTMGQTLREIWNNKRLGTSPQNNRFFRIVVDDDNNPALDGDGDIQLAYDGGLHIKEDRTVRQAEAK